MAQTIQVMEKPEWFSYDDIAEVLHAAHKKNISRGLNYSAGTQSGAEIESILKDQGKMFVASCGDKLVGVGALFLGTRSNSWYGKGKPYGKVRFEAVLPEYQGMGISSLIRKKIEEEAYQQVDLLVLDTAERNHLVRRINRKRGWYEVGCLSWKTNNYYSVVMAKWRDGCPFSQTTILKKYWKNTLKRHLKVTRYGETRKSLILFRRLKRFLRNHLKRS